MRWPNRTTACRSYRRVSTTHPKEVRLTQVRQGCKKGAGRPSNQTAQPNHTTQSALMNRLGLCYAYTPTDRGFKFVVCSPDLAVLRSLHSFPKRPQVRIIQYNLSVRMLKRFHT